LLAKKDAPKRETNPPNRPEKLPEADVSLFQNIILGIALTCVLVGLGGLIGGLIFSDSLGVVLGVFLILAAGGILVSSRLLRQQSQNVQAQSSATLEERKRAAIDLRQTREREQAFYEVTTTLSRTLDYRRILDTVQSIGEFITRKQHGEGRLVSAALLFKEGSQQLEVISSRGFSLNDTKMVLDGREGILGLALKQADPVFGGQVSLDPELQYVASLQGCESILVLPLRSGMDYYGVLLFGSTQTNAFSEDYTELLKAIANQATLALQNAVLYQNILAEKERIIVVEEEARKQLARDLHDGPTQSISAIAMRLNFTLKLLEQQKLPEAQSEITKLEDLARRTTKEIRHMLFTLRPLVLETQGLVAALEQMRDKMQDTYGQRVAVEAQVGVERWLDANAQGVVFYIIEEAVGNARKYAQSELITVRLYRHERFFVAEVEDRGKGFDVKAVETNYEKRGSLGMVNMRERANLIRGQLRLESQLGRGTKITLIVPIEEALLVQAAPAPDPQNTPVVTSKQSLLRRQAPTFPLHEPGRSTNPPLRPPRS
jgi:signal transduction histidine kinase